MSRFIRIHRLSVAALMAGLVIAPIGLAPPSQADPGVTVELVSTLTGPGFTGTWTASGAIADEGSFARVDANVPASGEHSPVVGTVQVVLTFTGAEGTFSLRDELTLSSDRADGTWQVTSGTGAYARLSGHGRSVFPFATDTITFTGVMSLR